MDDHGHECAEGAIGDVRRRQEAILQAAEDEARGMLDEHLERFREADEAKRGLVEAGELSEAGYRGWRAARMTAGERYAALLDEMAALYAEAAQGALSEVGAALPAVAAENANWAAYCVDAAAGYDTAWAMLDAGTVGVLLKSADLYLPKPSLDVPKQLRWDRSHIHAAVAQGVLLGEPIPKISARLSQVTGMDARSAARVARTSVTAAENAGRAASGFRAEAMGIRVRKEWLATLDLRTRSSHRHLDGEKAGMGEKFSNGLRYPGDPEGPGAEVSNCRCTLAYAVEGVDQDSADRWSRLPEDVTYEEWKAGKPVAEYDSSGRTMGEFFDQPSVKAQLEKRSMSENQARKALSTELERRGTDGNAFRRMQKAEQQEALRSALQSKHAQERMAERGVTSKQVDDAIANPLHTFDPKTDELGRRAQKLVGRDATVVVNPDTGVIITTYKTGKRERRKYGVDEQER